MNDKDLKTITTRIPADLYVRIKVYAAEHQISLQEAITEALQHLLKIGGDRVY